jgi:hypothetical protein
MLFKDCIRTQPYPVGEFNGETAIAYGYLPMSEDYYDLIFFTESRPNVLLSFNTAAKFDPYSLTHFDDSQARIELHKILKQRSRITKNVSKKVDERLLREVKNWLAGDGNAYDRMNAGQGGTGLPQWFKDYCETCSQSGVTFENFDRKVKLGSKLYKLLADLAESQSHR